MENKDQEIKPAESEAKDEEKNLPEEKVPDGLQAAAEVDDESKEQKTKVHREIAYLNQDNIIEKESG